MTGCTLEQSWGGHRSFSPAVAVILISLFGLIFCRTIHGQVIPTKINSQVIPSMADSTTTKTQDELEVQ